MPIGINQKFGAHYFSFVAVKFVGYSLFAIHLNKQYEKSVPIWKVGLFRTLLGISLGAPFGYFFQTTIYFFYGIGVLRIIEWAITIMVFYDHRLVRRRVALLNIAKGIIVSFILDIPAIFGFLATGGLWVC